MQLKNGNIRDVTRWALPALLRSTLKTSHLLSPLRLGRSARNGRPGSGTRHALARNRISPLSLGISSFKPSGNTPFVSGSEVSETLVMGAGRDFWPPNLKGYGGPGASMLANVGRSQKPCQAPLIL